MRIRILCGSYTPSSPFIDGGCTFEWEETVDLPRDVVCPGCGEFFEGPWVRCALESLRDHVVFVLGCPHSSFTFSRRRREPYFHPIEVPGEAEDAEPPTATPRGSA